MAKASNFTMGQTIPPPPSLLEPQEPISHLREIVEMYMASHRSKLDGSIHKALNTNDPRVRHDPKRHKWVETEVEDVPLESLYKNVEEDEREFLEAVRLYEGHAERKFKVGISMDRMHTMEEVIGAIHTAQEMYNEKGQTSSFAPIHRAFRKLGENIDVCNSWLELVPRDAQNVFSIICGGIKLIIGAAGRLRLINDAIVDALVQIPTLISKTRRIRAVNSKASPRLRDYCSALYVAILRAMGHILEFYQQTAITKAITVFIKSESFPKTLLGVINAMKQCSVAIDEEAALLNMESNKETNHVVKQTRKITEQVFEKVGIVEEQTGEIYERTGNIHELVRSLSQESYINSKRTEVLQDALNNICVHFMAKPLQEFANLDHKASPSPSTSPQSFASFLDSHSTRKKLLSRLTSRETPQNDMLANLQSGLNSTLEDQASVVFMMSSSHLQNFLQTTTSSLLFAHGGPHKSSSHRSPLSFVCAKLASSLKETKQQSTPTIISLHFFCGEHANRRDNHVENGPAGVLNSLLAQLLAQYREFDLSLVKHLKKLRPDNIRALGKVFAGLIAQLPSESLIFCMVDGLAFYDDEERGEELKNLVERLVGLVRERELGEQKAGCVFKLLVTNLLELRVGTVTEELDEQTEVLRIPERPEGGHGFSDLQWDLDVEQEIATSVNG